MNPANKKKNCQTQPKKKNKKKSNGPNSLKNIEAEIEELKARIAIECSDDTKAAVYFTDLPISKATLQALKANSYRTLTSVQVRVLPKAFLERDLLVQAPTGSGKTLAFVIPLLESLYRKRWDRTLGLASLILTPTRELATQIFHVIKSVGRFHEFSVACVIGGKDFKFERSRLSQINIIIATPGRLLQHLEGDSDIDTTDLQLLVLDEADQMLDMGFQDTLTQIIDYFPKSLQTWLFSATLNFGIQKLALLSLQNPISITVQDQVEAENTDVTKVTPHRLREYYLMAPLEDQINILFSFLRMKSQNRFIVFVNSCKQVRYLYETFFKLKPGPALFELLGRQSQQKRFEVFKTFSNKPRAACLICTDIASRGLDFQKIDWVIQLNCPFDTETYIHRVGRTARYKSFGNSLLYLLPSEKSFLQNLENNSIFPQKFTLHANKLMNIQPKLSGLLASR